MAKNMPSDAHIRREAELEGESFEHEREEYEKPKKKHVRADGGKARRRLDRPTRRQAGGAVGMGQPMPGGMPGGAPQLTPQQIQMLQARRAQMMQGQGMPPGGIPMQRPPGMAKGGRTPNFHPGGEKGKLHREMGVPESERIPAGRLEKATHSSNPEIRRDAIRAETMKKWHHTGSKG